MAGRLVPLVVFPRYTTFVGGGVDSPFTSLPLEVSAFQGATITVWRGPTPSAGAVYMYCEESSDGETWSLCEGEHTTDYDPGVGTEGIARPHFRKKWFRGRIKVATATDRVTWWAVGHLERREA